MKRNIHVGTFHVYQVILLQHNFLKIFIDIIIAEFVEFHLL